MRNRSSLCRLTYEIIALKAENCHEALIQVGELKIHVRLVEIVLRKSVKSQQHS